eukprot:TRINITY_DN10421_c0_g1_i1.p1 TRINITY_DN10421_c0_g1~~TRINITY_DN10421_c0_g1_i1.p1  ORF type:complete len:740 (+),score=85.71 TRINITY_DN10421_c0_g1_i1:162-2222(+)
MKSLRQHPTNLILFLSACDFMFSLKYAVTSLAPNSTALASDPTFCHVQALWGQFWGISSISWNGLISLNLLLSLMFPFKSTQKYTLPYHAFVWTFALTTTLIQGFTYDEKYLQQSADMTCWDTKPWVAYTCFFVPLLFYMFLAIVVATYGIYSLVIMKKTTPERRNIVFRMILYISVFLICWSGPIVNRLYLQIDHHNELTGLQYWDIVGVTIQGFLNALVWLTNPSFVKRIKQSINDLLARVLNKKEDEADIILLPKSINDYMEDHDVQRLDSLLRFQTIGNLLDGIKLSFSELGSTLDAQLAASSYKQKNRLEVVSNDLRFGSLKESNYAFKDYGPLVFHKIRILYNISINDYLDSLNPEKFFSQNTLQKFSDGRSGSFFCFTPDKKFLLKTLTRSESRTLFHLLKHYYPYLEQNRASLLPRFYGLYSITQNFDRIYFVVTANALYTSSPIHSCYDLKGSWVRREVGSKDRTVLGMDVDFKNSKNRIRMPPTVCEFLVEQLDKDTKFLSSMHLMDYSILLGLHFIEGLSVEEPQSKRKSVSDFLQKSVYLTKNLMTTSRNSFDRLFKKPGGGSSTLEEVMIDSESEEKPLLLSEVEEETILQQFSTEYNGWRSTDGSEIYFISLIDILQNYNMSKKIERFWKVNFMRKDSEGVSVQPPKRYYRRFMDFVKDTLIAPTRDQPNFV